jgi:hypothetical protein
MLMAAIARIDHGYRAVGMLLVRGYVELGRLYAHYSACPHGMFLTLMAAGLTRRRNTSADVLPGSRSDGCNKVEQN